jgi:hypothetical protein
MHERTARPTVSWGGTGIAAQALEAAGDLAGLADAWIVLGKMRLFSGSGPPRR